MKLKFYWLLPTFPLPLRDQKKYYYWGGYQRKILGQERGQMQELFGRALGTRPDQGEEKMKGYWVGYPGDWVEAKSSYPGY